MSHAIMQSEIDLRRHDLKLSKCRLCNFITSLCCSATRKPVQCLHDTLKKTETGLHPALHGACGSQISSRMAAFGRFCCGSRLQRIGPLGLSLRGAFDAGAPGAVYATRTLRDAQSLSGRRSCNQRCKPLQVLSDGRQHKLILGASRAPQPKPIEPQDALQVGEPHLDLLTLAPRLLEAPGAGERPGNVSGVLMDVARYLA